jgi:hypothetical protein
VGKTVRIRGRYWSDGSAHEGFFGASCPNDSRYVIGLAFPDAPPGSVVAFLKALASPCRDNRLPCSRSYQLDATGKIVVDERKHFSVLVTEVNNFQDLDQGL